jgi:hypothetical protein
MKLEDFEFPEVTMADVAFPTFNTIPELYEEAKTRDLTKGTKKFNELFFSGGKITPQEDVEGTWKEKAFMYARALMGSFAPKHEEKEAVCAMIFQETLVL